jgi:hypothetical protein
MDHTPASGGFYIRGDNVTIQDSQSTPNQFVRMDQGSGVAFNDGGLDHDFRVESDSYASALLVDAGENAVFVGTTAFYDTDTIFAVRSGSSSQNTMHISNSSSSSTGNLIYHSLNIEEGTGVGFQLMADYNDNQIFFRGDGNGFFDGAADAGNADFAEYFESTDGSAIAIGKTVVLDNGKVRASTSSDDASAIIGVVRPKEDGKISAVIGNSGWNKWHNKYLTDDFGVWVWEDYTVKEWTETINNADGTVTTKEHSYPSDFIPEGVTAPADAKELTQQRRKQNPDWDKDIEYKPRSERDEWVVIGLLGQIPISKGQKTGDRWIKMKDISDTIEEWYIR